jgi:hypothetical protein
MCLNPSSTRMAGSNPLAGSTPKSCREAASCNVLAISGGCEAAVRRPTIEANLAAQPSCLSFCFDVQYQDVSSSFPRSHSNSLRSNLMHYRRRLSCRQGGFSTPKHCRQSS